MYTVDYSINRYKAAEYTEIQICRVDDDLLVDPAVLSFKSTMPT